MRHPILQVRGTGGESAGVVAAPAPQAIVQATARSEKEPPATGSVAWDGLRGSALSQYDRVAARLLCAAESAPYTLAVTSSVCGEGVSSVCVGVTKALAASTCKRVVLVDANLRKPALHTIFGLPSQPGLHEVIVGNENCEWWPDSTEPYGALGPKAVGTQVSNLWLVTSGAAMQHPAQVTTSEGARTAVWGLRARFDFVVLDCPPILSAVDGASICRLADGVVLVVRAGSTRREEVKRARELLHEMPILGVILNGV